MGNLLSLLTSFRGRISRKQWWLGFAIIAAGNLLGGLLLNPDFFLAQEPAAPSWPDTIWQSALLIPMTAITVKRFNDADRPSWLGFLFAPLGIALYLGPHIKQWVGPIDSTVLFPLLLMLFVYF